jgi:uncharacterized protein
MAGRDSEERVVAPAVGQAWRKVTFLHWRVDPALIGALLPDVLEPDVVDGSAWIAVTPFCVERFRVFGAVPVPFESSFPETNVRTYVRDKRDGRDGLRFLSIDVASVSNVVAGRLAGVPYHHSTMSVSGDTLVRYSCRRSGDDRPAIGHEIAVEPGDPIAAPDNLLGSLTGRWRAYTSVARRTFPVPVEHEPWPLRAASIVSLEESLTAAIGLTLTGEPLVHYSDGVDARLGLPGSTSPTSQG